MKVVELQPVESDEVVRESVSKCPATRHYIETIGDLIKHYVID